jgi:hypothetical protein
MNDYRGRAVEAFIWVKQITRQQPTDANMGKEIEGTMDDLYGGIAIHFKGMQAEQHS